jgi:hypothetical protein
MNTLQTALVNYKPNYCPSSSTVIGERQSTKEIPMTSTKKRARLTLAQKEQILTHYTQNGLNGKEISEVIPSVGYQQIIHYLKTVKQRRGGATREIAAIHKAQEKETRKTTPRKRWSTKAIPQDKVIEIIDYRKAHPRSTYKEIANAVKEVSYSAVRRILKNYEAGIAHLPPYTTKSKRIAAIRRAARKATKLEPTVTNAPTSIDREIQKAELRLEILKELKAGK